MINTKVAISMRAKTDRYTTRRGVFQAFEQDGTNKRTFDKGKQTDFRVFRARIVPIFKMLDYETRYRVFESIPVLREVMNGFSTNANVASYGQMLKDDDTFHVTKDNTGADRGWVGNPGNDIFLITQMSFSAYENTYGHTTDQDKTQLR